MITRANLNTAFDNLLRVCQEIGMDTSEWTLMESEAGWHLRKESGWDTVFPSFLGVGNTSAHEKLTSWIQAVGAVRQYQKYGNSDDFHWNT